jgi:GntR family transcriptional regulator
VVYAPVMAIDLHASSPLPLYVRVASVLRERIGTGEWPPGTQIPTIDALREQFQVAEITLRQAIRILTSEGLVLSQRGKGTFVLDRQLSVTESALIDTALEQFSELDPSHRIRILSREPGVAGPIWDWRFGVPAKDYARITKLHMDPGGVPYAYFVMHVESQLFRKLPPGGDQQDKVIRLIRRYGKVKLNTGKERLTIGVAEVTEAEHLRCPPGLPVARIRRVFLNGEGVALFFGAITYRGDRLVLERDFTSESLRSSS